MQVLFLQQCDFQTHKNIIIPPGCVTLDKQTTYNIKPLPDDIWEPLIIIGRYLNKILSV